MRRVRIHVLVDAPCRGDVVFVGVKMDADTTQPSSSTLRSPMWQPQVLQK